MIRILNKEKFMCELNVKEIETVNGGVAPMLVLWACYTIMGPVFVAGVASGASGQS